MSLILDALKKSEKSRHDAANTVLPLIVTPRRSRNRRRSHIPVAPLVVILFVLAIAVTFYLFFRDRQLATDAIETESRSVATGQEEIRSVERSAPGRMEMDSAPPLIVRSAPAGPVDRNNARQTILERAGILGSMDRTEVPPRLSTLDENFRKRVSPLRLDFHVFSSDRQRRVVFLNGQEYREGAQVKENLQVVRIVPEGAILAFGDQRFLLTVKD